MPLLHERLRPVSPNSEEQARVARLVAHLDSDQFTVRQKAFKELEGLGEAVGPVLKKELAETKSAEVRRQLESLLAEFRDRPLPPGKLRTLRAIEVLEHIGTPEARQVLEKLAKGAPSAPETQDARRSIDRLESRRGERK